MKPARVGERQGRWRALLLDESGAYLGDALRARLSTDLHVKLLAALAGLSAVERLSEPGKASASALYE
jgi:hypothetical protein